MLKSRWGRRLAALYLLVVAFAGGFFSYHAIVSPRSYQALGAVVAIAGMPWSFVLARTFDPDAASVVLLAMGFSILLNVVLLYWLGSGLEHFRSRTAREAL